MAIELRMPFTFRPGRVKLLQEKIAKLEKRDTGGINIPGELLNALYGDGTGVKINENNATTLSSVWHAITIHCNSLNIPLTVFKRQPDGDSFPVGKEDRYEYQVHYLLHTSPNLMMTPSMWIQLMETSRLIYGNGYSFISRNQIAEATALVWVHPDRVEVIDNGIELKYNIKNKQGGGYWKKGVRSLDMLHVRNLSFDGVLGMGTIQQAKESMELGKNTQNAGTRFFKSNMRQAVVLTHPGHMSPEGQARLGLSFDNQLKSDKTIVLEEGIKPTTMNFSPEQSQWILSGEASVTEVARWFNLPESMLENNARATFSNIEEKLLWFLVNNVRPRCRVYEEEYNWKLLGNDPEFYASYNMNALMRASAATRATYYVSMVQNGIMSRNEIRQLENLNNVDGGDEFLTPMNLTTDSQRDKDMELKDKQVNEPETPTAEVPPDLTVKE